ncbi:MULTISPECIES: cytochrome c oxidase accessory protein CcoG [unclassified Pseudomonas]|uniref:cytochrome c oxidase accessory protein CcoG n=1 Tax=unclassified Pseudomonas TaxID=196821 RepID=UPI0024470BF8|nr:MULTISPECIES: cytochrome c oxidase accessory protein CcoG [unclassified Pseudomonas]MDG9930476.1 cytochrome c oxidase accessory protein CcoG [Pseudomonas sp. GD04042]MDH0483311.1 cytochrome c oxidase accessory protein CcoG [Pseudomonas sp. GD04015]MDH0606193.1 cytochrome c oxidase accessory protein CcoG [Pseudomonas sp. GD03869]
MSERIPAQIIESIDSRQPIRLTPSQAGGPIHTRSFSGRFRNLRLYGAGLLFLIFFGTAWLNWEGRQAVLWNLAEHRYYIFGATFWPQDFILLSALLIICAFGLFTITVFAGRVWCGYSCPQSVWTWVFMWVEKVTEGERNQRIKLDAAPWGPTKLLRRGAKHGLWLAVSLLTALTFVGYFTPIRPLAVELFSGQLEGAALFWVLFFTTATYLNAGWLREKVCVYMCPYARFQGVMFDKDTLIVSYDAARGEHRGPRKKESDHKAQGLGDCIDCTLCVQVCPTGIDIRDGLQVDCIGCAACIDACDGVMDKMGYARGLIRYGSEREMQGGRRHLLRPRLVGYAAALLLMIGAFAWALQARSLVSLDVAKDRGMYRENAAGQIENVYRLKVINKTQHPQRYYLGLVEGQPFAMSGPGDLALAAGEILEVPVSVVLLREPLASIPAPVEFEVVNQADAGERQVSASTFLAPRGR